MKRVLSAFFTLVALITWGCSTSNGPVNLIFDTDLGPDYDDVGAMAVMHALADSGVVNILATVSSNRDELVIPCMEVINTYFNRPSIPVGVTKNATAPSLTTWHKEKWTEALPAQFPHQTKKTSDAPDAVTLYRKILSQQPDKSVIICTVGFFSNLKDLLLTEGDAYSPLNGKELVEKKVKHLVSMAGFFPEGLEFNVMTDAPASQAVFNDWPTEIILSGFEIGEKILTGKKLVADFQDPNSPVYQAYALSFMEDGYNGRMSWDQTALLVAIKGYEPYYNIERGTMSVADNGTNKWTPMENGKHLRLIEKVPASEITRLIEEYMTHQPIKK